MTESASRSPAAGERKPVVIVGAGLAGLCCARRLGQIGLPYLVLEASDGVGGRVRTDRVDGFLLDRGFQVLLDSYPEARRVLEYDPLDLKRFEPGALVRVGAAFHRLSDPFRRPVQSFAGVFSPVGTLADKLRVAKLRLSVVSGHAGSLFDRAETTTASSLRARGFSESMIDRFFRPFFGGVFLEDELETSSRWFELLFRLFSTGSAALPAAGMQAIPDQIAAGLAPDSVRTGMRVGRVASHQVICTSGETGESEARDKAVETVAAAAVVVATEQSAAQLLALGGPAVRWRSVHCLYYAAPEAPFRDPVLVLGGDRGVINNLCVPSVLSREYAPPGQELVSVTVLPKSTKPERQESNLEAEVRRELRDWFGPTVDGWRHLRSYDIAHAQPAQAPGEFRPRSGEVETRQGVFFCGDYLETSSIHGAMVSGRKTADAVAERLEGGATS